MCVSKIKTSRAFIYCQPDLINWSVWYFKPNYVISEWIFFLFISRYPYFVMRILLAAIDHNFHLFRKPKQSPGGKLVGHRKHSKRTQRYHAEVVKEEKAYYYFPYMVARMLETWKRIRRQFLCPSWYWWIHPKTDCTNSSHEGATLSRRADEGTLHICDETQSDWKL